jgi:16S rRNA (adenine1518-N6/adenine1519-N6)-dimethyltransferase
MSNEDHPFRAKKSLGQNFLVDKQIVERMIADVSPQASDIVIEIGPGTGALTAPLSRLPGLLIAVEADTRLVAGLRASFDSPLVQIISADALSLDWGELIDSAHADFRRLHPSQPAAPRVRIVANLPYYISTAILQTLFQSHGRLYDMTLMLQEEVVDRIASPPGGREYGYLSVMCRYYSQINKLFRVPPSSFEPAPKIWSAVVRLTLREQAFAASLAIDDESSFFALVRACFAQRRKNLLNNLKAAAGQLPGGAGSTPATGLAGPEASEQDAGSPGRPRNRRHLTDQYAGGEAAIRAALVAAGIDPKRRAETLSLEAFAALYKALGGNQSDK